MGHDGAVPDLLDPVGSLRRALSGGVVQLNIYYVSLCPSSWDGHKDGKEQDRMLNLSVVGNENILNFFLYVLACICVLLGTYFSIIFSTDSKCYY